MIISAEEFSQRLRVAVQGIQARAVTGPGRSGAIASVYASHMLGIPWLPFGAKCPEHLRPLLIIDTASKHGRTLRRAADDCE